MQPCNELRLLVGTLFSNQLPWYRTTAVCSEMASALELWQLLWTTGVDGDLRAVTDILLGTAVTLTLLCRCS